MTPFLHASFAALYIMIIVSGLYMTQQFDSEPNIMVIPMIMLSLLVLSVLVMGYLFMYEPLRLHFEGKQKEGVLFFGKTVAWFAGYLFLFLIVALLLVQRHSAL